MKTTKVYEVTFAQIYKKEECLHVTSYKVIASDAMEAIKNATEKLGDSKGYFVESVILITVLD